MGVVCPSDRLGLYPRGARLPPGSFTTIYRAPQPRRFATALIPHRAWTNSAYSIGSMPRSLRFRTVAVGARMLPSLLRP